MPDFSRVKQGDRVYSLSFGWGTVERLITGDLGADFPIGVRFASTGGRCWFNTEGYQQYFITPTLYWSEPTIIEQPCPKRMVKRSQDIWINLWNVCGSPFFGGVYCSKEDARKNVTDCDAYIDTAHGTIYWEEEEK